MKMDSIDEQMRSHKVRERWVWLDRLFAGVGEETSSLLLILLALAILCAPAGFGLVAAWLVWLCVIAGTGNVALGWVAAFLTIAFYCRYVWGSRLQAASRRAAEAVVAGSR